MTELRLVTGQDMLLPSTKDEYKVRKNMKKGTTQRGVNMKVRARNQMNEAVIFGFSSEIKVALGIANSPVSQCVPRKKYVCTCILMCRVFDALLGQIFFTENKSAAA